MIKKYLWLGSFFPVQNRVLSLVKTGKLKNVFAVILLLTFAASNSQQNSSLKRPGMIFKNKFSRFGTDPGHKTIVPCQNSVKVMSCPMNGIIKLSLTSVYNMWIK